MAAKANAPKKQENSAKKEEASLLKIVAALTATGGVIATLLNGINELIKNGHSMGWW